MVAEHTGQMRLETSFLLLEYTVEAIDETGADQHTNTHQYEQCTQQCVQRFVANVEFGARGENVAEAYTADVFLCQRRVGHRLDLDVMICVKLWVDNRSEDFQNGGRQTVTHDEAQLQEGEVNTAKEWQNFVDFRLRYGRIRGSQTGLVGTLGCQQTRRSGPSYYTNRYQRVE